jgi:hypothetical protein
VQGESDYLRNVRVQTGIANPIPALEPEREKIAVLTPIKRPDFALSVLDRQNTRLPRVQTKIVGPKVPSSEFRSTRKLGN